MVKDIIINKDIIEESLKWAKKYGKDAFPKEVFKDYRRKLNRIYDALSENCSAAAYGESQVGKSYLMSSLLSSPDVPFVIHNNGREYSFIDEINSSGGENTQKETTGVITRFTIRQSNPQMKDYVKITNLSVVDIILLLTDSYYKDVNVDTDNVLLHDNINNLLNQLSEYWSDKKYVQEIITEDDIRDIHDYIKDVIGTKAVNVTKSEFTKIVSSAIKHIKCENWVHVFGLLWNNNSDLNRLFNILINEYQKIGFMTEIYVPFDTILRENGTLLNIEWLDSVCGVKKDMSKYSEYTNIYDRNGALLSSDFSKAYLSALIAEITFVLPESLVKDRMFLKKIDLLDFPGARSREEIKERELSTMLPVILRRGKVAYLFNKYSRSLKISSVLFCHHNHQKSQSSIGSSLTNWIDNNIGGTPEERAKYLNKTNGIAPLFFICTKFNLDLERAKLDMPEVKDKLDSHWARFNNTIPEMFKQEKWMTNWVPQGTVSSSSYYQNLYLLRDFYYSSKNMVFDGYDGRTGSVERNVHVHPDYPEYFTDLRESFCANPFVRKHFADPLQSWNDVATVNNDGSKAIIRNLDSIAGVLDAARREKYLGELIKLKQEFYNALSSYYESDDKEENNIKLRRITGDIKLKTEFAFGANQELFGQIIDRLMVSSSSIRSIVYDIIVRHVDKPESVSSIKMIRALSDIDTKASRESNIAKLCARYNLTEDELSQFLSTKDFTIDDIISDDTELLASTPDVISKHIVDYWNNHINNQVSKLSEVLPHSDEIAFMLTSLLAKLGVKKEIAEKIHRYYLVFDTESLPNAIADFASLTLNNFVSTAGRGYMTETDIESVKQKAQACNLDIDLSSSITTLNVKRQPLLDVLSSLDNARKEVNNNFIDMSALRKLPFWGSYQRWENFITIGLLYASDISHVDPVANAEIKSMLERCSSLYN